jgi:hypothetical protein
MLPTKRYLGPLVAALAVALLLGACDAVGLTGHDELSLERRPYLGEELRLDGYYYRSYTTSEGTRYTAYLLYRDGVIRYGGNSVDLATIEEKIALPADRRYDWGVFHVDGDRIKFEMWFPPTKGYTSAYLRSGHVLNDTTFVITELRRARGGERSSLEETYRFRAFSPKPDSTNPYVQ